MIGQEMSSPTNYTRFIIDKLWKNADFKPITLHKLWKMISRFIL